MVVASFSERMFSGQRTAFAAPIKPANPSGEKGFISLGTINKSYGAVFLSAPSVSNASANVTTLFSFIVRPKSVYSAGATI